MGDADEKDTSVRVAVRIRPQSAREKIDACRVCTFVTPGESQISIGKDKRFTYDHVFDIPSTQGQIYDQCVKRLVNGCFNGYNATVLAYGQTGSGKTYTMGTGFDISKCEELMGIIPRAVDQLFTEIEARKHKAVEEGLPKPEFIVTAQFMELYNEEIKDLFDVSKGSLAGKAKIQIHGDSSGNIYAVGVTSKSVNSSEELMKCLQEGALNRTTASTRMNAQSSRSHAIFSVHLKQTRAVRMKVGNQSANTEDPETKSEIDSDAPLEFETLTAKFHFTDLAGSERLKRTGATGDRAKEGIAINCGLLALGNVISALGDPEKSGNFVPYRDSKLTRLLQDSLGGNSQTLMIACVSPSDSDFMETVSTLTYANRARNIQNKVVLNQDKASQQVQALRQQIMALQIELTEYKTGKRVAGAEGYNDMYQENTMLKEENEHLRMRVKAIQEKSATQTDELSKLKAIQACGNLANGSGEDGGLESIIGNYIKENELLRSKLLESEAMCANLRRRSTCAPMSPFASRVTPTPVPMSGSRILESPSLINIPILNLARKDVEELKLKKSALELKALKETNEERDENLPADEDDDDIDESQDESKEEFDDEDEEELNLSDSENDEEEDEDERKNTVQNDLAALTFEIDLKQNLIDELEAQKKRMDSLRHQYESKLLQMETKIRATEEERDIMLANYQNRNQKDEEKKIKVQYEKKLDTMKKELGKLKDAKRTHDKALKEQTKYQQQMRKLKGELDQMKAIKVRLMKEMREQQKKGKQQDTQRVKEITQLRKEGRKKESQIRTLESKNQAKDRLVQRKREEIEMLKKQMAVKFGTGRRKLVTKATTFSQGDKPAQLLRDKKHQRSRSSEYSSKQAKSKWQKIEAKISNVVMQREMITHMEKQMDRLIKQRESAIKDMQKADRRKTKHKANGSEIPGDLKTEISNLDDTIEFTNYQIEEIQSEILQVTESFESDSYMSSMLDTCTVSEYRYIVDHILAMVVNKSAMVLVSQNKIAELQARLEGELETSKHAQELMRYIVEEQSNLAPEISELIKTTGYEDESDSDSSPERAPSANGFLLPDQKETRVKARRRTATPQELLHGIPMDKSPGAQREGLSPILSHESPIPSNGNTTFTVDNERDKLTSTPDGGEPFGTNRRQTFFKPEPPDSLSVNTTFTVADSPSSLSINANDTMMKDIAPPIVNGNGNRQQDTFARPSTPPSMKPPNKALPPDVFARLTKFSLSSPRVNRGRMREVQHKVSTPRASYLESVQIAEGHTKPVLCLHATEHLLFSGSKDRTAKIWNLVTGQEFETLNGHPNNVNAVHRCPVTGLVFTVSLCYIKVWDIRTKAKCIKVLSSSGQILSPSSFLATMGRTNRMPDNEWQISDLALSRDSKLLYSAAGNTVKIWDLNKFSVAGKLVGHVGPVITLKVPETKVESVITGSKDHYVKSFNIPDSLGTIQPVVTLNPPHMDGVEALATSTMHNALFSASRDKSIKKWELSTKNLLKSEYQAHSSWVCTLDTIKINDEEMLISGGRDGTVKIWDIDNLVVMDDIRAHSDTINHIASNESFVYTASNDRFVKIWKLRGGRSKFRQIEVLTEEAICEGIL